MNRCLIRQCLIWKHFLAQYKGLASKLMLYNEDFCSKLGPVLLDQNITLTCVVKTQQNSAACFLCFQDQPIHQFCCSELYTSPVINFVSRENRTGTVNLGFHVKMNTLYK